MITVSVNASDSAPTRTTNRNLSISSAQILISEITLDIKHRRVQIVIDRIMAHFFLDLGQKITSSTGDIVDSLKINGDRAHSIDGK